MLCLPICFYPTTVKCLAWSFHQAILGIQFVEALCVCWLLWLASPRKETQSGAQVTSWLWLCCCCISECVASRVVGWLTRDVNAVRSFWLLIRQGIKWGFRKSLRMVGHGVRAFQKAKRGCGEPRNGCVAIACLLPTTNNLV